METPHLFSPLTLRGITLPNRIVVSPMCMYSSVDGFANDWHYVHLGSRAIGGAGLVITEAAAVSPEGRISPQDLGIWRDEHVAELARINAFMHQHGAFAGIQLAHAGRKASMAPSGQPIRTLSPAEGGWDNVVAPSAIRYNDPYPLPHALDRAGMEKVIADFTAATERSHRANFDVVEIHAAHGYLMHQFLSPLSNKRTDQYGGSFENRTRFPLEIVRAVRNAWPSDLPLFVRISASDWVESGGWDIAESVELAKLFSNEGVDLVDVSSGGNAHAQKIPIGPGYQTHFAERIRKETGIPTGAVGLITQSAQADQIVRTAQADLVLLARELLRDPYWPLRAAAELNHSAPWPIQYARGAAGPSTPRHPLLDRDK